MAKLQKLKEEIRALVSAMLYFAPCLAALSLVKKLLLAEYQIGFVGGSQVLLGVIVLSKVVLVLEQVSLGSWVSRHPAWIDVLLRTLLYSAGVFVVLALEEAFEARGKHGSFSAALTDVINDIDRARLLVNTFCVGGVLLGYNVLAVIRRHIGSGGLLRMFMVPVPEASTNISTAFLAEDGNRDESR